MMRENVQKFTQWLADAVKMRPPSENEGFAKIMHPFDDSSYLEVLSLITQEATVDESMVEYFANEALAEVDAEFDDSVQSRTRNPSLTSTASDGTSTILKEVERMEPDAFIDPDDYVPCQYTWSRLFGNPKYVDPAIDELA